MRFSRPAIIALALLAMSSCSNREEAKRRLEEKHKESNKFNILDMQYNHFVERYLAAQKAGQPTTEYERRLTKNREAYDSLMGQNKSK